MLDPLRWKFNNKAGAFSTVVSLFDPHSPTVKFDVFVHERQTQASAVRSASSSCDNASREAFKDEIAFFKRHAETVIFDSDPYL